MVTEVFRSMWGRDYQRLSQHRTLSHCSVCDFGIFRIQITCKTKHVTNQNNGSKTEKPLTDSPANGPNE